MSKIQQKHNASSVPDVCVHLLAMPQIRYSRKAETFSHQPQDPWQHQAQGLYSVLLSKYLLNWMTNMRLKKKKTTHMETEPCFVWWHPLWICERTICHDLVWADWLHFDGNCAWWIGAFLNARIHSLPGWPYGGCLSNAIIQVKLNCWKLKSCHGYTGKEGRPLGNSAARGTQSQNAGKTWASVSEHWGGVKRKQKSRGSQGKHILSGCG